MEPTEMNNQEEQHGQQPEVKAEPVASTESVAEPEDLASAFAAIRSQNAPSPNVPVATAEATGGEQQEQPTAPVEQQSYGTVGESSGYVSGIDWAARDQDLVGGIREVVKRTVGQEWQEQGRRQLTLDDLARRNEQTGEVYFINLDDDPRTWNQPGYRGTDRSTARQKMKEFNEDLRDQWVAECRAKEQELMTVAEPLRRMIAFAPVYERFDEDTKRIFDVLTEDYAIRGQDGQVYGYTADLNVLGKQAYVMAAENKQYYGKQNSQQTQQQVPVQPEIRQPVVDSRSSAGGSRQSTPQAEPKDIGDAIAMFERMQREQRKAR